jgi:4-amino-4-deoxy-L-arabinose transferase-like glycosyltransferase
MSFNPREAMDQIAGYFGGAEHRLFLLIALASLVFRALCIALLFPGDPLGSSGDAVQYHFFGLSIAQDPEWISKHLGVVPPAYPMYMAVVYKIFGNCPQCALYAQSLLAGLSAGLMYLIGRRLFGVSVGILAALAYMINPSVITFGCMLLREPLILFSFLLTTLLVLDLRQSMTYRRVIWLGVSYTLLIHTDPRFLMYLPFLGLFILVRPKLKEWRWRPAILFASVVILLAVPWVARNYRAYDRLVLIDIRTLGFIQFKQAGEFICEKPPPGVDEIAIAHGQMQPPDSTAVVADPAADSRTPNADPAAAPVGVGERTGRIIKGAKANFIEFWRIYQFSEGYMPMFEKTTPAWSRSHNYGSIVFYTPLFLLGIFGFVSGWRRDRGAALILAIPIVLHTLLHMTQFVNQRYRLPIEMNVTLFAMLALIVLIQSAARRLRS